ncbi:MAG: slipin family protein [Gemmatimonadetes bacterium]|jgi:regulator of protease activity HflC (stomatin/prohibitin superfamily)|nr:slipin family protein [Gemmatimonadota bacterium]
MEFGSLLGVAAIIGGVALLTSLRILMEYQRGVVFRLGRLTRAKGPGLIFLVPFGIERMKKMDLRIVALDIPSQDTITKDNVSVKVNAVVYFRVTDPSKAVVEIEDYYFATSQLAQTTLRSVIGQSELDDLLIERDQVNRVIRDIIDEGTNPWGIEVTAVEVKDIDLPQEMKRAMARQAEAERERRGKVIAAAGEAQAAIKLAEAAKMMQDYPVAIQLRFLQTAVEIAAENNSTTIFPIPMDLFTPILEAGERFKALSRGAGSAGAGSDAPEAEAAGDTLPAGGDQELPAGIDPAMLTDAAKALLGIGSGAPSSSEEGVPATGGGAPSDGEGND